MPDSIFASAYFAQHPEKILGTVFTHNPNTGKLLTDAFGKPRPEVRGKLSDAILRINVPAARRYQHDQGSVFYPARHDKIVAVTAVEKSLVNGKKIAAVIAATRAEDAEINGAGKKYICGENLQCLADSIVKYNTGVEYKDEQGQTRFYDIGVEERACYITWQVNRGLYDRETIAGNDWGNYYRENPDWPAWFAQDLAAFNGQEWFPASVYYSGNIYAQIELLKSNKQKVLDVIGEESYVEQFRRLEAARPNRMRITDDTSAKLYLSPFDKVWNDPNLRILELTDGSTWEEGKAVPEAFKEWLYKQPEEAFRQEGSYTSRYDLINYWINKDNFRRGTEADEKAQIKRTTSIVGPILFDKFLLNALLEADKRKVEEIWNRERNNYREIQYHRLPVGFTANQRFKGGKLDIRPAQREGVAFCNYRGTGIVAYDVGVGKTMTGILAMADGLEKGLFKRPMLVVPNQVYHKWIAEISGVRAEKEIVRNGKVVARKGDLISDGILPTIKINDYFNLGAGYLAKAKEGKSARLVDERSITIVSYEGLEKIGFDNATEGDLIRRIQEALSQGESGRAAALLEQRAENWVDKALKDTEVNIDDMGIDFIMTDECHNFRNLFMEVRGDVGEDGEREKANFQGGQGGEPSSRAVKLFMLHAYVQSTNKLRNTIGLSATPFTNRATEIYSMMAHYDYTGMHDFDCYNLSQFCTTFIDETYEDVATSKGTLESRPVIRGYNNLPTLQSLVFRAINYKTGEEANIKRPIKILLPLYNDEKGVPLTLANVVDTKLPPTPLQQEWLDEIFKFAQQKPSRLDPYYPKDAKGRVPGRDLISLNAARVVTLSPYMLNMGGKQLYDPSEITPERFIESSPKFRYVCECIRTVRDYHLLAGTDVSGQIIYTDRGTQWFGHIKQYLVEQVGYANEDIHIFTGEVTKEKREWIKQEFLSGKCKVLIGTSTMKEGVDLQTYGTIIYNCYLDWNPTDHHQLMGRIWRFGNTYSHVRICIPLIENSSDVHTWQKLSEKMSRLNSIWTRSQHTKMFEERELNAEELKRGLITNAVELAKADIDKASQAIRGELAIARSTVADLERVEEIRTDFAAKTQKLEAHIQNALLRPSVKWDTKMEAIEKLREMAKDATGTGDFKKTYLAIRRYASLMDGTGGYYLRSDVDAHQKAMQKIKSIEENVLARYELSFFDDTMPVLIEWQKKFAELSDQEVFLKSDDYYQQVLAKCQKEKDEQEKNSRPVGERVKEFSRLNFLLDCMFEIDTCDIYGRSTTGVGKRIEQQINVKEPVYTERVQDAVRSKNKSNNRAVGKDPMAQYPLVKQFMPKHQQMVVSDYGEERDPILADVEAMLTKLPTSRSNENVPIKKRTVYAHYFYGNSEWYILEYEPSDDVFFGFAILNSDTEMAEAGDISRREIIDNGKVELDFHWQPITLGAALAKAYPGDFEEAEAPHSEVVPVLVQQVDITAKLKIANNTLALLTSVLPRLDGGRKKRAELEIRLLQKFLEKAA